MAEETRPFIGYRSAGRRPEAQQDRRAAADAPLSALRGMVSGVLGAPGDIESLVRMLPGLSERTVLPTSEDVEKRLPMRELNQTPTGKAFTAAGQIGGGFYTGPGSPLRAVAALPSAVSRAGRDFAMASGQPAVNVVKPKGGNWLAGSVERAIEPMRIHELPAQRVEDMRNVLANPDKFSPEEVEGTKYFLGRHEQNASLNKWLESKLAKYMRNEMATPEDPLRALAERGITHTEIQPTSYNVAVPRSFAGFPEEGMAKSPQAKLWEDKSDTFVSQLLASDITKGYPGEIANNPWLLKVPPETRVYDMLRGAENDLGFAHLADELRNAINPASGLPENLLWKYQDLEKVTVPQAVERVAKINEWRAAHKAEADAARAMNPATQVVKEYPEQGFKWVELRQPKELPEGWAEARKPSGEVGAYYDPSGATVYDHPGVKTLEDALKYEGETMGHCVGGYCPDVIEGRSRIYSLRDKKGQPHVTIEVQPGRKLTEKDMPDDVRDMLSEQYGDASREEFEAAVQQYLQSRSVPDAIVQIKGKGNRAPNAEYLPAVQDFVRSGNFGKVGDLGNTGLIDVTKTGPLMKALQDIYGRNMGIGIDKFNAAFEATPDAQRFMTKDELLNFLGETPPEGFARGGAVRGYQAGGVVKAAKKTMRSLGDMVDEYVRKVRKFEELGEPSYDVKKPEAPTSADVPGWHITQDLSAILKAGAMDNRLAGTNMQGWEPAHIGGAYFYSDPRLALAQHQRLMEMVGSDPAYAAELPILRAQLRKGNRLVPDEDVSLNVPWQESYQQGSFATKRPVLLNQIDRIYSADPDVTKDMIRDTVIRQRRPGYAEGGQVSGANFPTDDFDPDRIDAIVGELHAMNAA